jgi:cell division protein FtsI (penicillin-binding protein 3)
MKPVALELKESEFNGSNYLRHSLRHQTEKNLSDMGRIPTNYSRGKFINKAIRLKRSGTLVALIVFWLGLVVARLCQLQLSKVEVYSTMADGQHYKTIKLAGKRGMIMDRNGTPMAMSIPAVSVYAHPKQVALTDEESVQLADALQISKEELLQTLGKPAPFVWLRRKAPTEVGKAIKQLNLKGIGSFEDSVRKYPQAESAALLLGVTGMDGNGLSGLEAGYEKYLKGQEFSIVVARDGNGIQIAQLEEQEEFRNGTESTRGKALQLTIDADIQTILNEEVALGRKDANSVSAFAIMVDAQSGEILAMGQAPTVDFNQEGAQKTRLRNLIAETVFEPGSTMKPLIMSAALEIGVVSSHTALDCEHGRFYFGRRLIKDVHGSGTLPVRDIIVRSSNIGMSKIGILMGKENVYRSLTAFGFGQDSGLGLPGSTRGILRHVDKWSGVDVATHSFGQGVAVTALQMVRATSALANGGVLPPLSLVKGENSNPAKRVISEANAALVKDMLIGVVTEEHGTGHNAAVEGVLAGGKTGTAQKAIPGGRGYAPGKYIASFVGFVDPAPLGLERPFTLMVAVDEPNAKSIYGGTLAAPVFKRIAERTIRLQLDRKNLS